MPETRDLELFEALRGPGRAIVGNFAHLTPAQRGAIPLILDRRPVLLVARTASGKTEAVLAPLLTLMNREQWRGRPSILYLAPTRALVNNLYDRLTRGLQGFVDVGRRTGEHREPDNELLVTTPESLDSMLVRGRRKDSPHLLAGVRAIVLDELHMLADSPRGTQVRVLLARLDRVVGSPVLRVGLSATVPDPTTLAQTYLGPNAETVIAAGHRAIIVHGTAAADWSPRDPAGVDPAAALIGMARPGAHGYNNVVRQLVALREEVGSLKALVFVPSRARCDAIAGAISEAFQGRVPVEVFAHHGSLDKARRERTEATLRESEESVTVATSTLEVGIDIGDVNVVVLDGPPPSVSALLQRVGRGNRRSDTVRVLPIARNQVEAVTMASMLRAAISGELDPPTSSVHYSVAIQQLASMFAQARGQPRREVVEELLAGAYANLAPWLLRELEGEGWVEASEAGNLRGGPQLDDIIGQPMRLHGNIASDGRLTPLVDAVSGEAIAWIPEDHLPKRILVAGSSYTQRERGDVIELSNPERGGAGAALRYTNRSAPIGRSALRHLAMGLGLPDNALVIHDGVYHHFGGALFGALLKLAGVPSGPLRSQGDPRMVRATDIRPIISARWQELERLCGFGPFQRDLPDRVREAAVAETVAAHGFQAWLDGLVVVGPLSSAQLEILKAA